MSLTQIFGRKVAGQLIRMVHRDKAMQQLSRRPYHIDMVEPGYVPWISEGQELLTYSFDFDKKEFRQLGSEPNIFVLIGGDEESGATFSYAVYIVRG